MTPPLFYWLFLVFLSTLLLGSSLNAYAFTSPFSSKVNFTPSSQSSLSLVLPRYSTPHLFHPLINSIKHEFDLLAMFLRLRTNVSTISAHRWPSTSTME